MATGTSVEISDIKPDGTGHYTSLAAWFAATKSGNGRAGTGAGRVIPQARVFGMIAGTVDLRGMTPTPTADYYVAIFAAATAAHNGRAGSDNDADGAGVSTASYGIIVGSDYTRLTGLRLVSTAAGNSVAAVYVANISAVLVDRCIVDVRGTSNYPEGIFFYCDGAAAITGTVQNTIVAVAANASAQTVAISATAAASTGPRTINLALANVTVLGVPAASNASPAIWARATGTTYKGTVNVTASNVCVFTSAAGKAFTPAAGTPGVTNAIVNAGSHNASSNAAAGANSAAAAFGAGASPLDALVAASEFTAASGTSIDARLKVASGLRNSGVAAGLAVDIMGNARPAGSGYDRGAFEMPSGGGAIVGSGIIGNRIIARCA